MWERISYWRKNQIINIYKYLVNDDLQTTITNIVQKATGVGVSSVFKILKENKSIDLVQAPKKNKPKLKIVIHETDNVVKSAIMRKVHEYFSIVITNC